LKDQLITEHVNHRPPS